MTTKTTKVRMRGCKYTEAEKADALFTLKNNGYDYTATSKLTGVPSPTLRKWQNKNGRMVMETVEVLEAEIMDNAEMDAKNTEKYFNKSFEVKMKLLEKIEHQIEKENNLIALATAYEKVVKYELEFRRIQATSHLLGSGRGDDMDNLDANTSRFIDQYVFQQIAIINQDGSMHGINNLEELIRHENSKDPRYRA